MKKILLFGIIVSLALSSLTAFPRAIATSTPKIYVDPKNNIFSTETTSVGDTFSVNISTTGWEDPGLYSFECKLFYDPTLLNAIEAAYPPGHFLPPPNFEVPPEINAEEGYVLFGVTKLGDVPGSTGSGVLATVTFEIIKAPPPPLSCLLEIKDVVLLDPDGNEVTAEIEHGYYEFSPPKPPVYLKVEPETVSAAEIGDQVTIQITINEMESALKIAKVQFKLLYNTTLLSTKEEWVTPGATYASFNVTIEADYVKVEIQMVTGPPFPEGRAILANIQFNVTYIPPTFTSSPLSLAEVALTDIDGNPILYHHLEDGVYNVPIVTEKEDLNGDGKVNIEDIYVFAQAFGSYPGHPRWDPRADMDGNGIINVIDAVLIAMKFHD